MLFFHLYPKKIARQNLFCRYREFWQALASACSVELALGVVLSFCFNEYLLSLVCLEKYIYSDKYVLLNKCHFYFPSSKEKGTTCISREDNSVKFKNLNTFSFSQMKTIKLAQLHCGRVFRFFF